MNELRSPVRFMITGPARTGSTLLNVSLQAHSDVAMHGEVFGDDPRLHVYGLKHKLNPPLEHALREWRDRDPVGFLRDVLFRTGVQGAVGMKFKYEELGQHHWTELREAILADKDIRVIRLRRENLFERYVSQHKAVAVTGVFNVQRSQGLPEDPVVAVDPASCQADFEQIRAWERTYATAFGDHLVLDMTYEEIAEGPTTALSKVQAFLGVVDEELPIHNQKLSRRPMKESVVNFSDIAAYFSGSEFERFFKDC